MFMQKYALPCLLALCCLLPFSAQSQTENAPSQTESDYSVQAVELLTQQMKAYPQEKVYLHTDKPYYAAGDTIWFKAYLLHAALHQAMHYSRYIYVELVNSQGEVVARERVRPEKDSYYCQLPVKEKTAPGEYSLRAYTNYMRNLSEDYFFRKEIHIGNAVSPQHDDAQAALLGLPGGQAASVRSQTAAVSQATYDVQFLPEGGHLMADCLQNVAFKAIDRDGWGIDVHGHIIDETGQEVCAFQSSHLGMGVTALFAQAGKSYTAVCESAMGEELRVALPQPVTEGYSLSVSRLDDRLHITVLRPESAPLQQELYLLAHMRGIPLFRSYFGPDRPTVALPTADMPTGVLQVLLLSAQGDVLSERLCFIRQPNPVKLTLDFDKTSYGRRERVYARMQVIDAQGEPVGGDFSLSVTDDQSVELDSSAMTIESYLLLTSDLRGHIERPGDYFLASNAKADYELDLLMMTQGWRRYDMPRLMKGDINLLTDYELEVGSTLCGRLQTFPIRRAIPHANISVFNPIYNYVNSVQTDNRGRFCIEGFEFPDSSSFFIQAEKKQQGIIMELTAEAQSFPPVTQRLPSTRKQWDDPVMERYLSKSRERWYQDQGGMVINLGEVAVTARKSDNLRKERGALYSYANFTFEPEEIEDLVGLRLLDVLLQAPGITLDGSGEGVLMRNAVPLIVIDNIESQMSDLATIQVADVEMIDILRDPVQTAMFRGGGNGVICIYLKRGQRTEDMQLGSHQKLVPYMGYTTPKDFYQPMYSVESQRQSRLPDLRSTLWWQPNLRSDASGQAEIRFYTGDERGHCTMLIEGVTDEGEVVRKLARVEIK